MLLKDYKLTEFQLFYFVALHGNDFIRHNNSDNIWIDFDKTLRHIQKKCKNRKDCLIDYQNLWNIVMTNELDLVNAIYSSKQVEYPYSLITLELDQVNEVKNVMEGLIFYSLLFLDDLNCIVEDIKYPYQRTALDIILSPCLGCPLISAYEFKEKCRNN